MKIFPKIKGLYFKLKGFCQWTMKHKFIGFIIIAVLVAGGYFGIRAISPEKQGEITYTTAPVGRGILTTTISGSGQISVLDQVDIKPRVSGDIVYAGVKKGDEVRAGGLLFKN
ncbi:MAG: hypothetical protein COT37_00340 [Parcubacteria group bacterium CG08_land_8_20_14_0_20_43_9]|nr:MAG: hypothetical protein COT37_00340 [Parcubacteria group bacterium CG08_land_8_20_14_0_20_43_9]